MPLLLFYLALALVVSFICSVAESVLLSIPPSYTNYLEEKGQSALSKDLGKLKDDLNTPLSAILTLNTISHTVGAAGAGAQASIVFGNQYIAAFSAVLTLLILFLSEIIPKTLGANYWRELTPVTVSFLKKFILFLYPFVWVSSVISRRFSKDDATKGFDRDELMAMANLSNQEGLISERESKIMIKLLGIHRIPAKKITTPRTVVFTVDQNLSIRDYFDSHGGQKFSRIPIYEGHPERISGFVLRTDLLLAKANKQMNAKLNEFKREIHAIPETLRVGQLFERFLSGQEQILTVIDEHGGFEGIITLEDVFEHMLDIDIVDESDKASNMQKLARYRWLKKWGKRRNTHRRNTINTKQRQSNAYKHFFQSLPNTLSV